MRFISSGHNLQWQREMKQKLTEELDEDVELLRGSSTFSKSPTSAFGPPTLESCSRSRRCAVIAKIALIVSVLVVLYVVYLLSRSANASFVDSQACNTVENGYQCFTKTSHLWGQQSPYFSVEQDHGVSAEIPSDCRITFAQILSRHGSRFPTASRGERYAQVIKFIRSNSTSFNGNAAFLKTYIYSLGVDNLVPFGESQMFDSGIKFYERYRHLAREIVPFVRASGSSRVIASTEKFIQGFQRAKLSDKDANKRQSEPKISVIFEEGADFNNTLEHSICTKFEHSEKARKIRDNFTDTFMPSIKSRLARDLPGVHLTNDDVISLMDMCPYDTVARTPDASELSPFCSLFTRDEWGKYDYLQSLDKYYADGAWDTLGPSQGIGFTNELIARLTQTPVLDHTSTNHTLDSNPATFPLNATLYADFSHDNVMISIYFALGLYNGTAPLSKTNVETVAEMDGYSASRAVPFAARAYVETMQCASEPEPVVRILVNDRVVPLHGCDVDRMGRCKVQDFVNGLSFARSGGDWSRCYT